MLAAHYAKFKVNLKKYLDKVAEDHETLFITRTKGKGVVMMSLEDYNSLIETMYLLESKHNAECLRKSLQELRENKTVSFSLEK